MKTLRMILLLFMFLVLDVASHLGNVIVQVKQEVLDGDGCNGVGCCDPPNCIRINNSTFCRSFEKMNFNDAAGECAANFGHLAILLERPTLDEVIDRLGEDLWVGGYKSFAWVWLDLTLIADELWVYEIPPGTGDSVMLSDYRSTPCIEPCLGLNGADGGLNKRFVCQY